MKGKRRYRVRYQRDEAGWWVAVATEASAQSQARTLEQARERVREALGALLDVAPQAIEITDEVRLPPTGRRALALAKKAVQRAANEAERAERATREAVQALIGEGLSLRDAGTLLGVSRQRVHQILRKRRKAG
jgi:predicted RNase H-like HicB family nuclease/predicted HTH domain antitoxin